MFRGTLLAAMLLAGCTTFPEAPDPVPNLGVGSHVYWTTYSDGYTDKLIEKLLVQGDGFALYQTKGEYAAGDESDYFALFWGVDYRSCDSEMPTEEHKAAVAALWPLEEGKTAKVKAYGEGDAIIKIGEATEFFLMGEYLQAHNITIEYIDDEDANDEQLIVLNDTPLTVSLRWDEESKDTVTLVTTPKPDNEVSLADLNIGTCASLINQETE